ncbi:MAG: AraC family transcriptional regulator, partial [Lachnospiraceae bacterium]
ESHNFWEFCYVDKGEVGITTNDTLTILRKGNIVFHQPNEFHNVTATGEIAPNLVVVSFKCDSRSMDFFRHKILRVDELERNLLANLIIEARNCFDCRLDDPYLQKITLKEHPDAFAAEQLIKLYLTQFLIHISRRYANPVIMHKKISTKIPKAPKSKSDDDIFNRVVNYLETNISSHITIEKICHDNLIGRSQLQKIFHDKSNLGIIEYFSQLKINTAKQLIRTNQMNFTQISEKLGYTSIHYFSRQFKKIAQMTPSEYASSIKALADGHFK